MKKYKLILSIDNEPIEAIYSGSLEEIDKYILNNNINNSADFLNHINKDGQYDNRQGIYKFEIYSSVQPITVVDLLYADDIRILRTKYENLRALEIDMFKKFDEDLDFNEQFFKKFVNPYTRQSDKYKKGKKIINENRIHAWQLINFQDMYRAFVGSIDLKTEDVKQRIEWKGEKMKYDIIYENEFIKFCRGIMGIKNKKTKKWTSKYDEKREFFVFYKYFDELKLDNSINFNSPNNNQKGLY